jgi:hypothetical protein
MSWIVSLVAMLGLSASVAFAQGPKPTRIGIVEFGVPADSVFTRAYLAGLKRL